MLERRYLNKNQWPEPITLSYSFWWHTLTTSIIRVWELLLHYQENEQCVYAWVSNTTWKSTNFFFEHPIDCYYTYGQWKRWPPLTCQGPKQLKKEGKQKKSLFFGGPEKKLREKELDISRYFEGAARKIINWKGVLLQAYWRQIFLRDKSY